MPKAEADGLQPPCRSGAQRLVCWWHPSPNEPMNSFKMEGSKVSSKLAFSEDVYIVAQVLPVSHCSSVFSMPFR